MLKAAEENIYVGYAKYYKCSIAMAIHDRDWPLNRDECIRDFTEAAGRAPTEEEINEMRPDSQYCCDETMAEMAREFEV